MFKKNHLYYALPAILISTLAVIAIVFAWQEPGDVPPLDNVPAPINVGSYFQSKLGPLTIRGQFSTATSTFLATHGGRVGIGLINPNNLIQVKDLINFDNILYNTAIGSFAGNNNTADKQTVVGHWAGRDNTGASQSAFGHQAGRGNTGLDQAAFGQTAGWFNQGDNQSAFGDWAGRLNLGHQQSAFGEAAGFGNTGHQQSAFGNDAGSSNTGNGQSAFGVGAGRGNSGLWQIAIGPSAGGHNTGHRVIGIGNQATYENTGNDVIAIGDFAAHGNNLSNQFIVHQSNINPVPLIQGNFITGNVGIGITNPGEKLDVAGTARMTGFQLGTSATTGHVLTADTSGVGTWQPAPSGNGGFQPQYAMAYCYCTAGGIMDFCAGPATPGVCDSKQVSMQCSEGTILSGGCFGVMNNAYLLRSHPSSLWADWVNVPAFDTWTCAFSANTDKMVFVHCQK